MKRKNYTSKTYVISFIIFVLLALLVISSFVFINGKTHYLTPILKEWESTPEDASPYQKSIRETSLIDLAELDLIAQREANRLTDEQFQELRFERLGKIVEDLKKEAQEQNRISNDKLKEYNNTVTDIWGPNCIYMLDAKNCNYDIQGWLDGLEFFDLLYWVREFWSTDIISDADYHECMEKINTINFNSENLSKEEIQKLIIYMNDLLMKATGPNDSL